MPRLFLALLVATLTQACGTDGFPSCDADSPEVVYARALPPDRLRRLVDDTEELLWQDDPAFQLAEKPGKEHLPNSFQDLEFVLLSVHFKGAHFRLQGCFDHWTDIVVVRNESLPHHVELWYGEHPVVKEMLWESQ